MNVAMTTTTTTTMMNATATGALVPRGTRALRRATPASSSDRHRRHRHRRAGVLRRSNVATTTCAALVEPATKVSFDDELDGLRCVGAGVREKKVAIVNVKVYAVALYAAAVACKAELAAGRSLLEGTFDKALMIELVRDVDGKTFWAALDEAVTPRIKEIATNMATKEDDEGNFMP